MRLRIVELPRRTVRDEIPFVVVVDRVRPTDTIVENPATRERLCADLVAATGARGAVVVLGAIELPTPPAA